MASLSSKTGFTPVQTRVTLANNATTSVQEFAAYDGQELTGFVFIDATTDYRATVKIQVVKNGAGTYEVAAADIAGDDNGGSPIVSFSMSGSVLRATLVSYAGFVSAYIQYNLNAPALGANFPLTVDGSNVTLATPTVQGAYKAGQAPGLATGAAIGAGFIGEVKFATYSVGGNSSGANLSGNSITLTAGIWSVTAYTSIANVAPTNAQLWISLSSGGAATTAPVTGVTTQRNFTDTGNTGVAGNIETCNNLWNVNTNTPLWPTIQITAPVSSGYQVSWAIWAIRIA